MAQVEQCVRSDRLFGYGEKTAVGPAEGLGSCNDRAGLRGGNLCHLVDPRGIADVASAVLGSAQPLEHDFGDALLVRAELGINLVTMRGKRCKPANRLILINRQQRRGGRCVATRPHARERVLQQRQLVRLTAEVVDQAVDQLIVHAAAKDPRRPGDRLLQLLMRQTRRQVLAVAHRLR